MSQPTVPAASAASANPVLVNAWRGNAIESQHRGAIAVVDYTGKVIYAAGDIHRHAFPRSSIKFLQAIPLVESGAADFYKLSEERLSFACASHNGENRHVDAAAAWLADINCSDDDLACGPEYPSDTEFRDAMVKAGQSVRHAHHNCSGKHTGLLTTCRYLDDDIAHYHTYEHPAQRRWMSVMDELLGIDTTQLPWGYDGCGIPTIALSLQQMAHAFARFANPVGLTESRAEAMDRIATAVSKHPYMIAGKNSLCTDLISVTGKELLVKTGAEGYYCAIIPSSGLGVAIKIDDGARRGSEVALGGVLSRLGALNAEQQEALSSYLKPDILNSRGETVGRLEFNAQLPLL